MWKSRTVSKKGTLTKESRPNSVLTALVTKLNQLHTGATFFSIKPRDVGLEMRLYVGGVSLFWNCTWWVVVAPNIWTHSGWSQSIQGSNGKCHRQQGIREWNEGYPHLVPRDNVSKNPGIKLPSSQLPVFLLIHRVRERELPWSKFQIW